MSELKQAEQATTRARTAFHRMPSRHRLNRLLAATEAEAIARLRAHGHHTAADYLNTPETP